MHRFAAAVAAFTAAPARAAALLLALLALPSAAPALAQAREEGRVLLATEVMEQLRAQRDQYIPDLLLQRAYGIAVIPEVKKGAFGVGLRAGKGVLLVRDRDGRFSHPVFISLAGGSFGWQVGVQSTDLVLVFTTRAGVDGISDGKLTLGGDASVAAGPVGRSASAATDASFRAEIYSYSRSSGIFAGLALDGTALTIDRKANARFYGQRRVEAGDITNGSVRRDTDAVRRLLSSVATVSGTAAAPAAPPPPPPPPPAPGAQTFPMEDAAPGQEPPKS
jgi:lipid-binding SYLF domain-containing protein